MNLYQLFAFATYAYYTRRGGRLMGRHCQARLARAQAKRRKAGKTVYTPG